MVTRLSLRLLILFRITEFINFMVQFLTLANNWFYSLSNQHLRTKQLLLYTFWWPNKRKQCSINLLKFWWNVGWNTWQLNSKCLYTVFCAKTPPIRFVAENNKSTKNLYLILPRIFLFFIRFNFGSNLWKSHSKAAKWRWAVEWRIQVSTHNQ